MKSRWFAAAGILGLASAQVAQVTPQPLGLPITTSQSEDSYALIEQGFELLRTGSYEQAILAFEGILREDYNNFSAHFGLGLALFRQSRLGPAAFEFEQLTRLFPHRFEGWYNLGVMQALQGNTAKAVQSLDAALKITQSGTIGPEVAKQAYLTLATIQRQQAGGSELPTLAKAHEWFPNDHEISVLLAQARISTGRISDATSLLYQVLQDDPSDQSAASILADLYAKQGMLDRAINVLQNSAQAATEAEDRSKLIAQQSDLLREVDPARAQALMEEAVAIYPDLWRAQYEVGLDRLRQGNSRAALSAFQVAERIKPNEAEVLLGLAMAYEQLGEYGQAYSYVSRSLAGLSPTQRPGALLAAGRIAYRTSNFTPAIEYLTEFTMGNRGNAEAWIWLGLAQFQNRNLADAATSFTQAQRIEPNNPQTLLNLGAVELAMGQFRSAEQTLNRALGLDPNNAEAWYNLGWALEGQERNPEARTAWRRSSELGYAPAAGLVN